MNNKRQILWLDAVKGIACWVVFLGHFTKAFLFLPFVYRWVEGIRYSSFVMNETAALNVFYVALSFIAAKTFLEAGDTFASKAGKGIIKRYFRLAIPVFMIECILFALQKINLVAGILEYEPVKEVYMPVRDIPFGEILYDSFVLCMSEGSSNVYHVFWMVNKLFIGYIYVILVCAVISFMKRHFRYLFLTGMVVILLLQYNEYCPIIYGVLLYQIYRDIYDELGTEKRKSVVRVIIGIALLVASTCFAGCDEQIAYKLRDIPIKAATLSYVYCWIGAILVMTGIVLCTPVLRLLDKKKVAALGKICFPVYLFHPVCIATFGEAAYRFFDARAGRYINHGVKAAFFASILSTALLSVAYVKWIEPQINRFIGFLMRKLEPQKEQ